MLGRVLAPYGVPGAIAARICRKPSDIRIVVPPDSRNDLARHVLGASTVSWSCELFDAATGTA
jgi:hypothetical protein